MEDSNAPSPANPDNRQNPPEKPADTPERDRTLREEVDKLKRDMRKADPLWFKLLTPLAIALVGTLGSWVMYVQQSKDLNIRLYSELITKQEEGENRLRSEMFSRILQSVLKPEGADEKDSADDIDRIKNAVVQLELLGRNFHETIDMKPVFLSLKDDISEKLWAVRRKFRSAIEKGDSLACEKNPEPCLLDTIECLEERIKNARNGRSGENSERCAALCPDTSLEICSKRRDQLRKEYRHGLRNRLATAWNQKRYQRSRGGDISTGRALRALRAEKKELELCLDNLNGVAERIKRKQSDVLKAVGKEMRIRVTIPEDSAVSRYWPRPGEDDNGNDTAGIDSCICSLTLEDAPYPRRFKLHIRQIDNKFNRVRVAVTSKYDIPDSLVPEAFRYNLYRSLDSSADTADSSVNGASGHCGKCDSVPFYRCRIRRDSVFQEFTLEHYDFPLVDNIYLSKNERCALVLNSIDSVVDVSLLYFPARYAALKDKSFYNAQALENLTKKIGFLKEKN